jgi:hypothetical protein
MANQGHFMIADITGYTAFLIGGELEHAQDILNNLFQTLTENIKPPFIISNFQGDAILSYAPAGHFQQGVTLLEAAESLYCAFTMAREQMRLHTTCTCQACANIPRLDLKLFLHSGSYLMQPIHGRQEISGPDVIVAHRMMKNSVREKTGVQAYALITQAAVQALDLKEQAQGMRAHQEIYEHIGPVEMVIYDLAQVWAQRREQRQYRVESHMPLMFTVPVTDIPLALPRAWEYVTDPLLPQQWLHLDSVEVIGVKNGRQGRGTIHHCAHGKQEWYFKIIDWRPFEYVTFEIAVPLTATAWQTISLQPTEGGTRVSVTNTVTAVAGNPLQKLVTRLVMLPVVTRMVGGDWQEHVVRLRQMAEEEAAVVV